MIDSHCHLNFESLSKDLPNIMKRCKENNITHLLSINTKPQDFKNHLDLIQDYNNIYISYGIHPQEINNDSYLSTIDIEKSINNPKLIALGETGLDFYNSTKYKKKQIELFEAHIEASKIFDLPIIIHQRNSEDAIIDVLNRFKNDNLKIVFHCFTGSKNLLNYCLENSYYISLSGIVTFKNANLLREIILKASLDHLLIETDSPYLAPVPMRGRDNEPSYVKYTGEYLAEFYSMTKENFFKLTDNNFYKLFSRVKKDS
ncbi:TatD family hydrolase [Pelagibacteraceae bacterium]|nr:TatD family hydrolase [Pelagibacteraceae bacterium]